MPNDEVTVELDGTERLVLRAHDGNPRHAVPLRHVRSITANPHVTFTGAALHAHAVFHHAHKPLQYPAQRWALAAYHAERTRWQNETMRILYAFEHFVRENWT